MSSILQYIIAACVLVLSALVAFYLFIAFLVVGAVAVAYVSIRRWLSRRDIASSGPVDSEGEPSHITIIEGEFQTVEVKPEPLSQQEGPRPE